MPQTPIVPVAATLHPDQHHGDARGRVKMQTLEERDFANSGFL
jgi:hypothetical protein